MTIDEVKDKVRWVYPQGNVVYDALLYPDLEEDRIKLHIIEDVWLTHGFFVDKLRKLIFSRTLNLKTNGYLRDSFLAKMLLRQSTFADAEHIYLYFANSLIKQVPVFFSKHILLYTSRINQMFFFGDSYEVMILHSPHNSLGFERAREILSSLKYIFSYNIGECKELGYRYYGGYHVLKQVERDAIKNANNPSNSKSRRDFCLFQSGSTPGTAKFDIPNAILKQNLKRSQSERLTYFFQSGGDLEQYNNVELSENYIQENMLKKNQSNCIISFVGGTEKSQYMPASGLQAIIYNKKLLTNSQLLKNLKCYDPRWIKVIEDPSQVDDALLDWMKKVEDVHYENTEEVRVDGLVPMVAEAYMENCSGGRI
ncbi:MAG: hypothetical protein LBQ41_00360 [Candidatus Ancillula sp.]|nr:hypothetical protein [Candidatus Ancillula sp.]